MLIAIYFILGFITLATAFITYHSYRNKNSLFKFWIILLIFNVLIILMITMVALFMNPFQTSREIDNNSNNNITINNNQQILEEQVDGEALNDIEIPVVNEQAESHHKPITQLNNIYYMYLLTIVFFSINSLISIFVYRDASARAGITGGAAWAIVTFFSSIIGLAIYILIRPVGNIRVCNHCKKLALDVLPYCPHCYAKNVMFKNEHTKEEVVVDENIDGINQ